MAISRLNTAGAGLRPIGRPVVPGVKPAVAVVKPAAPVAPVEETLDELETETDFQDADAASADAAEAVAETTAATEEPQAPAKPAAKPVTKAAPKVAAKPAAAATPAAATPKVVQAAPKTAPRAAPAPTPKAAAPAPKAKQPATTKISLKEATPAFTPELPEVGGRIHLNSAQDLYHKFMAAKGHELTKAQSNALMDSVFEFLFGAGGDDAVVPEATAESIIANGGLLHLYEVMLSRGVFFRRRYLGRFNDATGRYEHISRNPKLPSDDPLRILTVNRLFAELKVGLDDGEQVVSETGVFEE